MPLPGKNIKSLLEGGEECMNNCYSLRIVRLGGIAACLKYYDASGMEFAEQLRSMLVFDALIYN